MMLTLWGRATSSNVQKVHWLCSEIGLDVRRIDVGGKFGNTNTPEYLSKNPNGLIPVLEDEGLVLWESNAILRYVSAKHGNSSFYPTDVADRAVVDQWMDWQLGTLWPGMRPFFIDLTRTPEAEREHAATEALRDKSFALWSTLETCFTSRNWIAGTAMSLAEIALGPVLHRWFALYPEVASQQPALHRLYQQLSGRPAYQEHVIAQSFL